MVMSWIFTGIVGVALIVGLVTGKGGQLAAAIPEGSQAGLTLAISIAGPLCLWSGVGKLMEKAGITGFLSRCLRPILSRIFPSTKTDPLLAGCVSANICANLLGLGNAATPMGIRAAELFAKRDGTVAGDELCRLIVLNTASIQIIPATVAAIRHSLGSQRPFEILPAVWITSLCSAALGLIAAWLMGRLLRR